MEDWNSVAEAWLEEETDPALRAALGRALEAADLLELRRGFAEPLAFGTAGLRGPVGFGPGRMNEVVVARASFGLGRVLLARGLGGRPVVLGFDGRAESAVYAARAARVLGGLGLSVELLERPSATPVIVHAGRVRGAAAIVAVTPSHNPRGDAGFKVYDDRGIQIVAPWDVDIARGMASCPPVTALAEAEPARCIADEAHAEYERSLRAFVRSEGAAPSFASYTPLHGVGGEGARIVERLTGVRLEFVSEQATVDGTFPTTPFPNPEESGALDGLEDTMRRSRATLGLANDPDADRLAIVLRSNAEEEPLRIGGDQLGLLLASLALERADLPSPLLVSSIVSSPALAELARRRGARHEYTLTGFKWLCRPALDDPAFLFAYEEALGYCIAPNGRPYLLDKDGLGAMALLLDEVRGRAPEETEGAFLRRRLDRLAVEAGVWVNASTSLRFDDGVDGLRARTAVFEAVRRFPPAALGAEVVTGTLDFVRGSPLPGRYLGRETLLLLELGDRGRLCVRPSGTEPKLKLYLHLRGEASSEAQVREAEAALGRSARALLEEVASHFRGLAP